MLGLWSAAWLGGLLLAGLLRFGDLSLQWPVLLVPMLWALVALRRGRRRETVRARSDVGYRTDTVERPALRPRHRRDPWR
jgi:hypothetical protein